MGIGNKLVDPEYIPNTGCVELNFDFKRVIKCPVEFTDDPLEYAEGFLGYKLKPVQRNILIDLFEEDENGDPVYNQAVFIAGMRCLGLGTEVLMYDGTLKKIEDIKVGDLVMGLDSSARTVTATDRGQSNLYKIKQSCAMDYVVNENHILSLKKACSVHSNKVRDRQPRGRYPNYPSIVNIPIKEYLQQSKKWRYFFRGYTAGCIEFDYQDVPIDPYLLGIWNGDGNSGNLTITSNDEEVVDWIKQYCTKIGYRLAVGTKKGTPAKKYGLRHDARTKEGYDFNGVWEEFKKLGLPHNKHIPQCYISNTKEIRLKVLAGLLDTDGYYVRHGYEITLANETLIKDVKRLADSLGYRTNLRKKTTTCQIVGYEGVAWRLSIHGNIWEIPCLVQRKKYKHTGKRTHKEEGLSSLKIESLGWGEYAGIEVDKDSLYCLSDGTVVHNSGKSLAGGVIGSFLLHKLLKFDDPGRVMGQIPGQTFSAEFIATSEEQSKQTAFNSFATVLFNTPWWIKYIRYLQERELDEGKETLFQRQVKKISFPEKNLEALSLHSNSASLAGLTAFYVCFDEMSRFDVSEGAVQQKSEKRTAQAVYYTASRAAKTIGNFSKILTITSPMYETDFGMQLLYLANEVKCGPATGSIIDGLRMRYRQRVKDIIGYHYATWEANPKTDDDPFGYVESDFSVDKQKSYATFLRDYKAVPPSAISPFFELPERIDKSVNPQREALALFQDHIITESVGSEERKYIGKKVQVVDGNRMHKYFICCDQGAVKDSFAVAMGHAEEVSVVVPDGKDGETTVQRSKIIIDFVEAWKPDKEERITVSFQNVEEIIRILNRFFYIDRVVFDQWHSTESIERLFSEGVSTKKLGADIEMYETMKVLIYSGMVELPDSTVLLNELRQLNVVKGKKIDHSSENSKDLADAVVRVVWCVYMDSIRDAVHGNFMLPQGQNFPTIRSIAAEAEIMKQDMFGGVQSHFGLFQRTTGDKGVFGKSMIVEPNVVPNIGGKMLK